MKVAITGSSGLIGSNLKVLLFSLGIYVEPIPRKALFSVERLVTYVSNVDVVIHLAGANIGKRWTSPYMEEIYNSRVESTKNIVKAIELSSRRPELFVSASAVGIYSKEGVHDESSTNFSQGFLGKVVFDWEEASEPLVQLGVRRVVLRQAIVLAKSGGFLGKLNVSLSKLVWLVFGFKANFPWIHIEDLLEIYRMAIFRKDMEGVYNAVAPQILTLADVLVKLGGMKKALLKVMIPDSLIKLALGKQAEMIFDAPAVVPKRLREIGFEFKYKTIDDALRDLVGG
ncbi:MAG: TIGR01777 family oxidoreductase [Thermosulfidibacteraceae bacterium]|jgi:uncharacterized protein (TIGR01777 family)